MENNQKVSLGCGTLILIALIVMIFSHKPKTDPVILTKLDNIDREVSELKFQVRNLQDSVEVMKQFLNKRK